MWFILLLAMGFDLIYIFPLSVEMDLREEPKLMILKLHLICNCPTSVLGLIGLLPRELYHLWLCLILVNFKCFESVTFSL